MYSDSPRPALRRYLDTVVIGVANRTEELNATIARYSIGWDVRRISRLTRCIMQLAIFETLYMADVTTGVAIEEEVSRANNSDWTEAGAFTNGILGSFARDLASAGDSQCQ